MASDFVVIPLGPNLFSLQGLGNLRPKLAEPFRAKANALLRRLERLGWMQTEIRDGFRAFIVLPHYSSRLLDLFRELCEARSVEYQRFAFITYQLLTGEEARTRPSFVALEAERMTGQFLRYLGDLPGRHITERNKASYQKVLLHRMGQIHDLFPGFRQGSLLQAVKQRTGFRLPVHPGPEGTPARSAPAELRDS